MNISIFGEVLFDNFPDGSRVLGGAPFNVAWHLQAFGLSPYFISRIGLDAAGNEISALMRDWGISQQGLQRDSKYPTGSVRVEIDKGEPHYDIVTNSAYDFIVADLLKPTQGILYHGSLAIRNPISRAALNTAKAQHQGKIFIDVNLRSPWWDKDTLLPLIKDANWVKLNEAELAELCSVQGNLESLMQRFCSQFDIEILIVTLGAKGAVAWDNQNLISVKPAHITTVVDTVGAGDAFASVLLLGLSQQWSLSTTLERAQHFACELVARRGAIVTDKDFYRQFQQLWNLGN